MFRVSLQNLDRHLATKPGSENNSNSNHFGFGVSNKSKYNEEVMFRVSLQNFH